jgi:dihydrofolate reductase
MYETMRYWETAHLVPGQPPFVREFTGIWQAAEKIVFSKTLASVPGARTRIERDFDPEMVRQLKSAAEHDLAVGGVAGQAIRAGLVDELQLFLVPVIVGGGKRALPSDARSDLELLDTRRFASGAVYLRYRPRPA